MPNSGPRGRFTSPRGWCDGTGILLQLEDVADEYEHSRKSRIGAEKIAGLKPAELRFGISNVDAFQETD